MAGQDQNLTSVNVLKVFFGYQMESVQKYRPIFLIILEAENSRSRCGRVQFLLRPLSLGYSRTPLAGSYLYKYNESFL